MNINAIEELVRVLGQIDHKIKEIEISPNRAFVLIEYDTLSLFHWFNLCFKQFWDEFDRHSASQLLLYLNISDRYSELSKNYINLIREQISYLGRVIDFEHKCVKELPPVIFSEDNSTDVIGYYNELCKHSIDEDNKPLYRIDVDRDMHSEVINGKDVPIDFYLFRSNKINGIHYEGLYSMHKSLSYILDLMYTVSSYPYDLTNGTEISLEDTINALEKGLRQYAIEVGKDVERDLKIMAQGLKPSRNATIDSNVWGKVMDEEDRIYNSAISGKWGEDDERLLEHISATKEQLTENFALLQKIKTSSFDEELFDIRLSVKNHQLLSSINTENLDLFYELVLRRNIIHCKMFPEELRAKYDEWVTSSEELNNFSGAAKSVEKTPKLDTKTPEAKLILLLCRDWFNEFTTNVNVYTTSWRSKYVKALMKEFGSQIAIGWEGTGKRNKQNLIKGHMLGALKNAGVIKGTSIGVARKALNTGVAPTTNEAKNIASYMGHSQGDDESQQNPYRDWTAKYVEDNQ